MVYNIENAIDMGGKDIFANNVYTGVSGSGLVNYANQPGSPTLPLGVANVMSYGAKGDGVTDDTKAFQAALNAGLPEVYVPPGNPRYKITGLTMPTNNFGMILRGDGISSQIQVFGSGISWGTLSTPYVSLQWIKDLWFINNSNAGGNIIDTTGVSSLTLQNLTFTEVPANNACIKIDGVNSIYTHDVRLKGIQINATVTAGNAGILLGALSSDVQISDFLMNGGNIVNYCIFANGGAQSCWLRDSHPYNAKISVFGSAGGGTTGLTFNFSNTNFDSAQTGHLVNLNKFQTTVFDNCLFFNVPNGSSGVSLSSCSQTIFNGCTFVPAGSTASHGIIETTISDHTVVTGGGSYNTANFTSIISTPGAGAASSNFTTV